MRIHEVAEALASISVPISGSAGSTSVCESANATPASRSTRSTGLVWSFSSGAAVSGGR